MVVDRVESWDRDGYNGASARLAELLGAESVGVSLHLDGCIESTPSVFRGTIWVGTRGGGIFAIADRSRA
jgi:hypothetical protein